jgi:hypothetical protein
MFFAKKTKTTRIKREFNADGKLVKEEIETTENPADAEMDFSKMDRFFDKMDEAFKELFK